MHENLRSFLERQFPVTDKQFELIKTLFIPKKVRKGEFLLREGEPSRYSVFVASGCLRTYAIDNGGKEHILQFSPENWWTGDMSFTSNVPPGFLLRHWKILRFCLRNFLPFKN